MARAGSPKMSSRDLLPRAVLPHEGPRTGQEVDGEVDRQPQRQRRENGHRHVVVLAGQPDQPVDQADRQRQRDHAQQAPEDRVEEHDHQDEDDQEAAQERLEHADHHLLLPHDVDVGQAEPLVGERHGRRVLRHEGVHLPHDGLHVPVVAALELQPEVGVLEVGRDEVPELVRRVAVLELLQRFGHAAGRVGHAVIGRLAAQLLVDLLGDVDDRVALADDGAAARLGRVRDHVVLQLADPAQQVRPLEGLRPDGLHLGGGGADEAVPVGLLRRPGRSRAWTAGRRGRRPGSPAPSRPAAGGVLLDGPGGLLEDAGGRPARVLHRVVRAQGARGAPPWPAAASLTLSSCCPGVSARYAW